VIHNPVHHGIALVASHYRWCSAAWFEKHAAPSFVEVIRSFPVDRLQLEDDF
jgi:putative transposase